MSRRRSRRGGHGGKGKFEESKHRRQHGRFSDKPGAGDDAPKRAGLKSSGVTKDDVIVDLKTGRDLETVGQLLNRHPGGRKQALTALAQEHRRGRVGFRGKTPRLRSDGAGQGGSGKPITPLAETPEWKAAGSQAEREKVAVDWVRRGQREAGAEHLVVFDREGRLVHAGSSGAATSVVVPPLPPGRDYVLHHSHPNEVSLSPADFRAAWRQSPLSEARAYTPSGSYLGRSLVHPKEWWSNYGNAVQAVGSELRVLARRRGGALPDLSHHLVNAELADAGRIWYRFKLSKSSQSDLSKVTEELDDLRALIRSMLG